MSEHDDVAAADATAAGDDMTNTPGSIQWANDLSRLADADVSPRRAELRRVSDAVRRVIHGLIASDPSDDELATAANQLEAVATIFDRVTKQSLYEGFAESANSGDPHAFFDHSPMLGRANPLAPPIVLRLVDDRTIEGVATFGAAYEGPPGCVHGGYIAAAFDEVLGSAQSLSGQPGMTGRLAVDYRSPTPLHEEVRISATYDRTEGRKVFVNGTLHAGERLCAEAQGLFVSVDLERFADLRQRRNADRGTPGT